MSTASALSRNGKSILDRIIFETSRAAEYFTARELQAQTGQPMNRFPEVMLKELIDNGLDAAETAGVAPVVTFKAETRGRWLRLTIQDNGSGLRAETIDRILNFTTRTSDKALYRTPTRGLQGNALKTVLGIPYALGCRRPIVIEAHGLRHRITAWIDPAGEVRTERKTEPSPVTTGTRVTVTLPTVEDMEFSARHWARGFAIFNPHATVRFCEIRPSGKHANSALQKVGNSYHALAEFPKPWAKYIPTDRPSAW